MRPPFLLQRTALPQGRAASSGEGRDCELSRRMTALLLFPRVGARPGPWLLFLASVCTYVAVRALELGHF
jgi:hypothetical protein